MNAIDQFPPRAGSSYGGFPCSLGQRSGVRFIVACGKQPTKQVEGGGAAAITAPRASAG
jgi:hypothetical protein